MAVAAAAGCEPCPHEKRSVYRRVAAAGAARDAHALPGLSHEAVDTECDKGEDGEEDDDDDGNGVVGIHHGGCGGGEEVVQAGMRRWDDLGWCLVSQVQTARGMRVMMMKLRDLLVGTSCLNSGERERLTNGVLQQCRGLD